MKVRRYLLYLTALYLFFSSSVFAQNKPGKIIRSAPVGAVRTALDPNADDFVSVATAGFSGNDDVTTSEIAYKPIAPYNLEPNSDLRRGPNHLFTDFVPGIDNSSYYMFYRNNAGSEALLFRMRLGTVMPGAKGYSVLFDTDRKFGASGPNADPNYVAATTGIGGNPGFEVEIVLATGGGNDGVLIYNVDGTDNPGAPTVLAGWTAYSQLSIAATNDYGDPDFYLDWYVPLSALNAVGITTSTSFRVVPTTVMAPKGAIGGPKSDIYGLADNSYKDPNKQYEDFINGQPAIKLTDISGSGTASPTASLCTAAPSIGAPVNLGASVTITGGWTKSSLPGAANSATIYLYKNGGTTPVAQTAMPVSSGAGWSISGVAVANGDVFTARAQGSGESICLVSNSVTAQSCLPSTMSSASAITITCASLRGFDGTAPAGAVVRIYTVTPSGYALFADETTTTYKISHPTATRWIYDGPNVNSSDPCTGGATDVPAGSYAITIQEPGKCESDYYYYCNGLGTTTASPVVTQTNLYGGNATVSGTAASGAAIRVFVNGQLKATTTATGGNFSVSSLALLTGDVVDVYAQATGQCISAKTTRTATCFTAAPAITTETNGQLKQSVAVSGISGEPTGTVIRLYNASGNTLMATTAVQADGTWSTANAGTTNSNGFTGVAVGGASYYATAQNGSCSTSAATAAASIPTGTTSSGRCGAITTTVPATAPVALTIATTSVSGTLSGTALAGTVVAVYQDGLLVGSLTTSTNGWGPLDVTNKLYNGGVISLGIQEPGKAEVSCATTYTVSCTPPLTPTVSFLTCTNCGAPANPANISNGGTITYRLTNLQGNTFYSLREQATGKSLTGGVWTDATPPAFLDITTYPLTTGGSFTAEAVGTSVSASGVCSAKATQNYNVILPVSLTGFKGRRTNGVNELSWTATNELDFRRYEIERSTDGSRFATIGAVAATGAGAYNFTDRNLSGNVNYYRLKLVNGNGSFTYSPVVLLKGSNSLTINLVKPNPFVNEVELQIGLARNETIGMLLLDERGKQVLQKQTVASAGNNVITLSNLGCLAKGVYLLRIATGTEVLQQKLVKLQ